MAEKKDVKIIKLQMLSTICIGNSGTPTGTFEYLLLLNTIYPNPLYSFP